MNPILLAASGDSKQNVTNVFKGLDAHRTVVVATTQEKDTEIKLPYIPYLFLSTGSNPVDAGILLMRKFWESIEEVVIASNEEPGSMILGSTLAAHLSIPFIPWQGEDTLITLLEDLSGLGIRKVFFCSDLPASEAHIFNHPSPTVIFLDHEQVTRAVIEKMGPENIYNIVVGREPIFEEELTASFIAPYYSMIRNALVLILVLISETGDPSVIEDLVFGIVKRYSLKPRTITLLGDYEAIGQWRLKDTNIYGDEEITIEPCSLDG